MGKSAAQYCFDELRKHDRDRYLTTLFAPEARRAELAALYTFNLEISRIPYTVSEPMLAEIRLQWWRDAIASLFAGNAADHPVIEMLDEAMARATLSRVFFENLIDSRVRDVKKPGFGTLDQLLRYADGSSASLVLLAMEILNVGDDEPIRRAAVNVGIGWALISLVRAQPKLAQSRYLVAPDELLTKHGVDGEDILAGRSNDRIAALYFELLELGRKHLAIARSMRPEVPKAARSPLLMAQLADRYADLIGRAQGNPFAAKIEINPLLRVTSLWKSNLSGRY